MCPLKTLVLGLPWWLSGKENLCQFRRCVCDLPAEKILRALEPLKATAAQLWSLSSRAQELRRRRPAAWSARPAGRGPHGERSGARALQGGRPRGSGLEPALCGKGAMRRAARVPQLEGNPRNDEDLAQPKTRKNKRIKRKPCSLASSCYIIISFQGEKQNKTGIQNCLMSYLAQD